MKFEERIREKLNSAFPGGLVQTLNESPQHGLPASAEKHFRVVVVSDLFAGQGRVDRHRRIMDLLATELKEHVHALAVQAFTPDEWRARGGQGFDSPECLGGGKRER